MRALMPHSLSPVSQSFLNGQSQVDRVETDEFN